MKTLRGVAPLCAVSLFCLPAVALAQSDSGSAGTAGGAGDAATSTGTSGAATSADTPGQLVETAQAVDNAGFSLDELSFNPGFGVGCAESSTITNSSFGGATLAQPVQIASAPRNTGRYVKFSVSGSEIYTDNINQSRDGDWDLVTQITPRAQACSDSGRIKVNLDYALEGVVYANNSNYDDVYNNLEASSTISVVPNHLFLDVNTRYGQAVIDPSISYSTSNSLNPGNKTGAWVSNISPYLVQSLGPVGNASLRYRYGYSMYGNDNVPDRSVQGVFFNLSSPRQRERITYALSAQSQRVKRHGGSPRQYFQRRQEVGDLENTDLGVFPFADFEESRENDDTNHFDSATLRLGYQLTNSLQLLAQGGLEDDYQRDGSNDRFSQPSYEGGFRWQSATSSLEGRVGHRFFGTTYYLSATHQTRLFRVNLSYNEQPTSQGLNSLNGGGFSGTGGYGGFGGFGGYSGVGTANDPVTSLFDRGVFVERRWSGALTFNTALTETILSAYRQKRDYRRPEVEDDTYTGVNLLTQYEVQPRTTIVPEVRWNHREAGQRGTYDNYQVGLTGLRTIRPSLQAGLGYLHAWRRGDNDRARYDENRITLQVLKNF